MTAKAVRWIVLTVCVGGIAGMIVMSIKGSNGGALTFGIVTSAAILCMIVATAVANERRAADPDPDAAGAALESRIGEVVDDGADEAKVRALVADAIRYGRTTK